jgi:hypothetical protein
MHCCGEPAPPEQIDGVFGNRQDPDTGYGWFWCILIIHRVILTKTPRYLLSFTVLSSR